MSACYEIRMKVLHVIAGAGRGGAETFCLDAITALHEAGVAQHAVCRPHPHFLDALGKMGISYDVMAFSRRDRLGRGQALIKKAAAEFSPDLVHAWMGRAASFIPKALTVPVLGWFGGYYDLKRYRTCDFYMGVTKDIVRHIIEKTDKPHRAFLVHTLGTLQSAPPVDRATLATPPDMPVALLLSRMHWKKGVDTLLEAAQRLPGVYFWLAGDGPELETYRAMARGLEIADRVRFLGWRTDRAALLGAADVCVLPSRYEPFGTVIPEAWSMGVPLVASRADGARQYVTDGEDGLLCKIDDPAELAAKINIAINDGALREGLKKNGLAAYQKTFSKKVVTDSLIAAYRDIKKIGKKTPSVISDADKAADSSLADRIERAARRSGLPLTPSILQETIRIIAAHETEDAADFAGMSVDIAYLHLSGLYNFREKRAPGRSWAVRILSATECDIALGNNRRYRQTDPDYQAFADAFLKNDGMTGLKAA